MKSGRTSRRSIRYSVFIGVLAGSVFSGSGAFAADPLSQENFYSEINTRPHGNFELTGNIDISTVIHTEDEFGNVVDSAPTGSSVFGTFTGSLLGNNFTISGLNTPLFYLLQNASITNLNLETIAGTSRILDEAGNEIVAANGGLIGHGVLSAIGINTSIDCVDVQGIINSQDLSRVGGLIGDSSNSQITKSSSNIEITGFYAVGGLVGFGIDTKINSSISGGKIKGVYDVGGAIGHLEGSASEGEFTSAISEFTSTAEVQGRPLDSASIGGVVGFGSSTNISNVSVTSPVSGLDYVGGILGMSQNSVINSAQFDSNVTGSAGIGGIVGYEWGTLSTVTNSFATGVISGNNSIGGIIGESNFNAVIQTSSFSGDVYAQANSAGGLVGAASNLTTIQNSFVLGRIQGLNQIGGLIGYTSRAEITNSYASTNTLGHNYIGGLIGAGNSLELTDSFSEGTVTSNEYIGGLAGIINGNIDLRNTYSSNNLETLNVFAGAGLIGITYGDVNAINSYASGNLNTGSAGDRLFNAVGGTVSVVNDSDSNSQKRSFSDIFGSNYSDGFNKDKVWGSCSKVNSGSPFLTTMYIQNPCLVVPVINFEGFTTNLESSSIQEIQKTLGFKNQNPIPKSAPIAFVEATEKIDLAKVKAVEIAPTANVRVAAKAGEALQISLKSESKEPVELWVKSPDGSWLLAGVITFDKDGKAILPPLQFKNAGDYTLVLNKPSVDSAKGSAPLNQSGSVLVAVS